MSLDAKNVFIIICHKMCFIFSCSFGKNIIKMYQDQVGCYAAQTTFRGSVLIKWKLLSLFGGHRKVIQMKQDFLFFPRNSIQHYIQCKL